MYSALNFWIDTIATLWYNFVNDPVLSVGFVTMFFIIVIKYFDKIKEIFK